MQVERGVVPEPAKKVEHQRIGSGPSQICCQHASGTDRESSRENIGMPEWAVALLASLFGALVGGAASAWVSALVRRGTEDRAAARAARADLLKWLDQLDPSQVARHLAYTEEERYAYRKALDHHLRLLPQAAAQCSAAELDAAARVARAWRSVVPLVSGADADTPVPPLTDAQYRQIDEAMAALRRRLQRGVHPFDYRRLRPHRSPVPWPDPL